jgi:hypothetical protein
MLYLSTALRVLAYNVHVPTCRLLTFFVVSAYSTELTPQLLVAISLGFALRNVPPLTSKLLVRPLLHHSQPRPLGVIYA